MSVSVRAWLKGCQLAGVLVLALWPHFSTFAHNITGPFVLLYPTCSPFAFLRSLLTLHIGVLCQAEFWLSV